MEDESWQLNLESWRQRRRAASKTFSYRTATINRSQEAEEEQDDSIREYLHQLKITQSRISDSAIPLMHPVKPNVTLSPESANPSILTNSTSPCDRGGPSETVRMMATRSSSSENRSDPSTIRIRLVNNADCVKAQHLGMEVIASGKNEGPPFYVGRLVQESMAERAKLRTGDEIYSIDNVCCTYKADRPPTLVTLSKVNQLLDRLTAANRAVEVRVIRGDLVFVSEDDAISIQDNKQSSQNGRNEGDVAVASAKGGISPADENKCGLQPQNPSLLDSPIVMKKGIGQISSPNSPKRFHLIHSDVGKMPPAKDNVNSGQTSGVHLFVESPSSSNRYLQTVQSKERINLSVTPSQGSVKIVTEASSEKMSKTNQRGPLATTYSCLPSYPPMPSSFSPRSEASEKVADSQSTPTLPPPPSPKQSINSSEPTSLSCITPSPPPPPPPPLPEADQLVLIPPNEGSPVSDDARYRRTPDSPPPALSPDIAIDLPEVSTSSSPEPLAVPLVNVPSESTDPLNVGEVECYCEGFVDSPVLIPITPLPPVETQPSTLVGVDAGLACLRVTDSHYSYVQTYKGTERESSSVMASETVFNDTSGRSSEQAARVSRQLTTGTERLELPLPCSQAKKTPVLHSCSDSRVSDTGGSVPPVRRRSPVAPPSQSVLPPARPPRLSVIGTWYNCAGCNQQLGASDLMIVEKLSLFYHLACFVCARCGMQLSDGQNETAVRIRNGLIYCYLCYHKSHVKDNDNPKNHSTSHRKAANKELQGQREHHTAHTANGQVAQNHPDNFRNLTLQ